MGRGSIGVGKLMLIIMRIEEIHRGARRLYHNRDNAVWISSPRIINFSLDVEVMLLAAGSSLRNQSYSLHNRRLQTCSDIKITQGLRY